MLKYLIIQLSDAAPSFCYYQNGINKDLISIKLLKQGISWAMKQNVSLQIIYPKQTLPLDYKDLISSIANVAIIPFDCEDQMLQKNADVIVVDGINNLYSLNIRKNVSYVLRIDIGSFLKHYLGIIPLLTRLSRINVIFPDVETINISQQEEYKLALNDLSDAIKFNYLRGHIVQCNLLTDRFMLNNMNNCNAGEESVMLAPDGKFYVCPAFYYDKEGFDIGDFDNGLNIKNPQLYRLDHAPLCRDCDAFHCKRCVWLNRKLTKEVGIPSKQQCVMSHIERNATRKLLYGLREYGEFLPDIEIIEIDYLDPFDNKFK